MDKMVKKGLEIGLGVTAITVAALMEVMNSLEKQGKINRKEGEKMVHEMAKKYGAQGAQYAAKMQGQLKDLVKSAPFASKKDIEMINAKIDEIADQIAKTQKKPAAKKGRK